MHIRLVLSCLLFTYAIAIHNYEKIVEKNNNVRCSDRNCISCDPRNPQICYICARPYFLQQASCVPSCTHGYQDHASGICTMCKIDHCDSCINSPYICNECDQDFEVGPNGNCIEAKTSIKSGDIGDKERQVYNDPRFAPKRQKFHFSRPKKDKVQPLLIIIPILAGILIILLISCCIYKRKQHSKSRKMQVPYRTQETEMNKSSINLENIPRLSDELNQEHIGPHRNNPVNILIDSQLNQESLEAISNAQSYAASKQVPKSTFFRYAPRIDELKTNELSLERKTHSSVDSPSRMLLPDTSQSTDKKEKSDEESGICLVCQDRKVNMVFLDCMHICTCEGCAKLIINANCPCPFCREDIKSAKKVFIA